MNALQEALLKAGLVKKKDIDKVNKKKQKKEFIKYLKDRKKERKRETI
jgi:hypothetical protein